MRFVSSLLIVLGATALLGVAAAPPAAATEHCPDPGGAAGDLPDFGEPVGDWVVQGRGWGHGVGMSQYGAQGAAELGCGYSTILGTYFPGAGLGDAGSDSPETIRVSLFPNGLEDEADELTVTADSGPVTWQTDGDADDVDQPDGATWTVEREDEELRLLDDDGEEQLTAEGTLAVDLDGDPRIQIGEKPHRDFDDGTPYDDGLLRVQPGDDDDTFLVNVEIGERDGVDAIDRYLDGLAEVPSSWHGQALAAQAVAGRSWAVATVNAREATGPSRGCVGCHLFDSPVDQVYAGAAMPAEWERVVEETAGEVLRYDGDVIATFYSSSHGGHSERLSFSGFFDTGDQPYLQAVDDSRWELASDNPNLAWSKGFAGDDVADAVADATGVDVGDVRTIDLPDPQGAGGRIGDPARTDPDSGQAYGGVVVSGTEGDAELSGFDFLDALGVEAPRSELFQLAQGTDPDVVLPRLAGPGRLDTAAAVAREGWDAADHAVLARADDYADALAAAALAAQRDAPLLLTVREELSPQTAGVLDDLAVETVTVMGGTDAVTDDVTDAVADAGHAVERVAGAERFATAADAARAAHPGGADEVAIALGTDWPDALAAGALAASSDRVPTLLVTADEVPGATRQALDDLDADTVHLIGGTGAISDDVADDLAAAGYRVERFAGSTRWDTSAQVAADALRRDGRDQLVAASGEAFPDALAAGAFSARADGVLVLVPTADLGLAPPVVDLLDGGPFTGGWTLGGTAAVSDDVQRRAAQLITD